MNNERLFIGVYPTGIVYADRTQQEGGDYKRLGYLNYATLELKLQADCPENLAAEIRADADRIKARIGQRFETDQCGHGVILGEKSHEN